MCSQQQVGNTDVFLDQLYMLMTYPTWLFMIYRHRVFILLHILHDPVWGIIVNDNIYLILSLHEVLHADHKMTML